MEHSEDKKGRYIVNPALLTRQQSLDVCAACHSGIRTSLRPPFSFVPGDTLADYYGPGPRADSSHTEVHGNQYGLLAASQCFRISGTLECRSCHDSHVSGDGDLAVYSQRCMSCHQPDAISGIHKKVVGREVMMRNCIDCHMPVQASSIVTLMVPGKKELAPLLVRSHLIAVYARAKQR